MTSRCPAAKIQQLECHTCGRERESKARVMDPSMAPADKISDAKAIFSDQCNLSYHVKQKCARRHGLQSTGSSCAMQLHKTKSQAQRCEKKPEFRQGQIDMVATA